MGTFPDIYEELVNASRSHGMTMGEVESWLENFPEVNVGRARINQCLLAWTDCGTFLSTKNKRPGGNPVVKVYYPTGVAFEPVPMANSIGVERANKILARLGKDLIVDYTPDKPVGQRQYENGKTKKKNWAASDAALARRRERYRAKKETQERANHPTAQQAQLFPVPMAQEAVIEPDDDRPIELPDQLFAASFRRDGVLISYAEFHRVLACCSAT